MQLLEITVNFVILNLLFFIGLIFFPIFSSYYNYHVINKITKCNYSLINFRSYHTFSKHHFPIFTM